MLSYENGKGKHLAAIRKTTAVDWFNSNDEIFLHVCTINQFLLVGFEILTAVVIKSSLFWKITSCSPLKSFDDSEGHIASLFRIEEYAKQEVDLWATSYPRRQKSPNNRLNRRIINMVIKMEPQEVEVILYKI
jgi:hypothetical protein